MKTYLISILSLLIILSVSVSSEDAPVGFDSEVVNLTTYTLLTKTDDASSFKENIQFLRNQGYTSEEALDILHTETVRAAKHAIFLKNMSKQDVEKYLHKRGYSVEEIDAVIETVSMEVIYTALKRGMKKETIISRFTEKGFTREEINLILLEVYTEQVKSAHSSGISSTVIASTLEETGFTKQEIEDILAEAGLYAPPKNKIFPVFWILLVAVLFILFFAWKRKASTKTRADDVSEEVELSKLQDERKTLEEMITLAKKKYHKRKLDEESFREIVKDHQKKLIEIETKINQIEARVQKLESMGS